MLSVDVESTYNAILNLISNKMTVKLDVLGPFHGKLGLLQYGGQPCCHKKAMQPMDAQS